MIHYVDHIDDPALFSHVVANDLEGIVAKRKRDLYATATEWVKVKNAHYSQNGGRGDLFHRRKS